jgi:asparagine synthase (glutamine-hydrolysing)
MSRNNRAMVLRGQDAGDNWGWEPSNAADGGSREDLLDQLAFDPQEYEFGLRLPELLLQRTDRNSMAHGVEARVPFLDPALVEFAYRLPPRYKLRNGVHKIVLKRAIADVVPERIIDRLKQGFGPPVERWLDARMGVLLRGLLNEEAVRSYFDARTLEMVLANPRLRVALRLQLWQVLNFALWHKRWIEGESLHATVEPLLT